MPIIFRAYCLAQYLYSRQSHRLLHILMFLYFLRCLVVYPWTQRYFGNFGNLYNAAAIKTNPLIAKHGTTILHGLDRAVKNMDDIKATYAELSVLHSEKLHVDPDNFRVQFGNRCNSCSSYIHSLLQSGSLLMSLFPMFVSAAV